MPFFFFSSKIYSLPSQDNYNQCKASLLAEHFPKNEGLTVHQKWANLISRFSRAIQSAQTNPENFLEKLNTFKDKRANISDTSYKLTLEQIIGYFEDFYFLYVNEDENYQLNQTQKKALLNDIKEIFDACDTGINVKCTCALQHFQKSDDWIVNTLVKARCNSIRLLHTLCETKFNVGTAYSAHVYNYLAKLANERGFGILIKEALEDIYEEGIDRRGIKEFFEQHFPQYQQKYQQEILENLSQELMCALSAIIPVEEWTDEEIRVPSEFYNDLEQFLKARFKKYGDIDVSKYAQLICVIDDSSDEHLIFKGKKDTQVHLMSMINEVLFKEEYLLSPERLTEEPALQSAVLSNQKYRVEDAVALYQAFQKQDQTIIQKHLHILRHCPQLCVEAVIKNQKLYDLLPLYIKKDSRFVDATVNEIQNALQVAVEDQDINDLLKVLNLVTAGEYMYLKNLSPSLRQHPKIIQLFDDINKENHDTVDVLCEKESISFADFFNALKHLSIKVVMSINQFRKKDGKSPIPFIEEYESALEAFIADIRKDIVDAERLDEYALKRKACEIEDFKFITHPSRLLTPISFLAKNRNVFEAFIEYQAYQSSYKRLFHLSIQMMSNLFELFKNTVLVLGCVFLFFYVVPLISNMITSYIFTILGVCCITYVLAELFDNDTLRLIANFMINASIFDIALYIVLGCKIFYNVSYALQDLAQIANNLFGLFQTSLNIFNSFFFKETTMMNVDDSCDSIIFRLEMIDELSAMQKASVLRDIHQQMKLDIGDNLIEKRYDLEYQGKLYQHSFKDVCNMSRSSKDAFSLTPSMFSMPFFRPNTVCNQQLDGLALVL